MPKLLDELDKVHQETFSVDNMKLLPGVNELLVALRGKVVMGLITGNLKTIAERKLTALGIWKYFTVGGFGSDKHSKRSDLVKTAINRADYNDHIENVYVIGDTPKDIIAATEAGVINSVGVANGFRSVDELINAGAKIVLPDFKNTQKALSKLSVDI